MVGSYLGLIAGGLLSLKGWEFFSWLPAMIGIENMQIQPIVLDAACGFIIGYILHLMIRIFRTGGNSNAK